MRSKRLFAAILALVMMFSVISPAASAVEVGKNALGNNLAAEKIETSSKQNGLVVSGEAKEEKGPQNLREDPLLTVEVNNKNSDEVEWTAQPSQGEPSVSLLPDSAPECLAELQKAAELYSPDEVVSAFVVMEEKPLAETYTSRRLVSADMEKQMLQKQDNVIAAIEKMVLGGNKLEVRYQFTYLTNAITIKTAFGNLEKIASMQGVKSVFLTPVYNPATVSNPNTASSGAMTGVDHVWEELGYTGVGMKIAIIDTGLDLDHPSFAAAPETNENSMTAADIDAVLKELNAYALRTSITGETLYRSAKVPYAFNYVDGNLSADHSRDVQGDHGTHVAGIAAANAMEGTSVVGMAPDAQIIVMKVFGAGGGAYADDIVAALEDAMILGCDVVNASLGSPAGFSSSDTELDLIYERLANQDIVATFSAGNEGTSSDDNMWGTDLNRTQNPDNATVGSPATWANTLAIASAENASVMTDYFTLADGTIIFYQDSIEAIYGSAGYEDYAWAVSMKVLADQAMEYVLVPGLGTAEDVASVDVEGKIALILRGELAFSEKVFNAEMAGAAGVVILNTNNTDDIFTFGMSTSSEEYYPGIPSCIVMLSSAETMVTAETWTMTVGADQAARLCNGGQMSDFSSWGVSPNLELVPDITGIGGNVYSTLDGGNYGVMSGTSMSAPQLAGITALVMQHLKTLYPDAPAATIRNLAEALLMSTADPIVSDVSGSEVSPRQQGAGLVNAYAATTTTTWLTVDGGRPKASLGDNPNGVYNFSFEVHNAGEEDAIYTFGSSLLTEYVAYGYGEYFMYGVDIPLDGKVTFDQNYVVVAPGETAKVNATIKLADADKEYFEEAWENGGYVEGYVYLYNEEGAAELSLPFLGFYGDWTDAPVFDTAYWYDNTFWGVAPANGLPEGDEYYNVIWTDLAGTDYVLGFNPYSQPYVQNGKVVYDSANNVVSPNGDGVLDGISEIYLSLLRNAKTLTFTYTVEGEVMHRETIINAPKTMYISSYGQVVPFIYSWYGWGLYNFTDAQGKTLPNGTEVIMTIEATVEYGDGGNNVIEIPITVDTQAPELVRVYERPQESGAQYLYVELSENIAPASVVLLSPSGTRILAQGDYFEKTTENCYIIGFDITGLGTEFMLALCDYAANESYYDIVYTSAEDSNAPTFTTNGLVAYRVYDDHLMSDHMYGFVHVTKPVEGETAYVAALTDDYLEYAAINAAEYVDGKIFAVDAVYNFMVLEPGLWNRKTICNLGVSVLDMAFDDSTGTMYLLVKDSDSYSHLMTIDLLTGEMEHVVEFGYYNYGPWAITFDAEGTLYAIKVGSSNLYTVDMEDGSMTAVLAADGSTYVMAKEDGTEIAPTSYSQSIEYSKADNAIYWAHFDYSWWGSESGMVAIDMDDLSLTYNIYSSHAYTADGQLVEYFPVTELVGLMVMEDTDYQLPDSSELEGIALDHQEALMMVGGTLKLKASPNPWTAKLGEITWTSSDESIVTVKDGNLTAVAEGTAVITATCGDVSAECVVSVIDVSGHFYAYNYFSGDGNYGYMIDVDMKSMNYSLISQPADFLAGDYNGHDGYFYGYAEGGQFYRHDINANETVALGSPVATLPTDMAYDYSTGLMYAMTVDYNMGISTLNAVNMLTGELVPLADMYYTAIMTLACDLNGTLYGIDYAGNLMRMSIVDGMLEGEYLMFEMGSLNYVQSMCYDYNNDGLIWAYPEASQVIWIDVNAEVPYAVSLGDPTDSGSFEFVGMFTLPAEVPELAYTAVESASAANMTMLVGQTKMPKLNVLPLNATVQTAQLVSENPEIVVVNADGSLTAVAEGTAEITGTLVDGENTFDVSFSISVIEGADDMYGYVMTDLATYAGQYFARLYVQNPSDPDLMEVVPYILFAEEYYDGNLYAVGYDANDYSGNWQMLVMDPITHVIKEQKDLGVGYPFVYDMTYDYATSTMYAVAGPSDTASDLYVMDLKTGALSLLMETEQFFMSLAASPDGTLYAMENSEMAVIGYDDWGWEIYGYSDATMYAINPIAGTVEKIGPTGVKSNMIASMSYDYDTDRLYWTPMFQGDAVVSGLAIVDPETAEATLLGPIGASGAQVSGLYIICDEFPAENKDQLHAAVLAPKKLVVNAGLETELTLVTLPMGVEADVVWNSSNENVATVENGVVTGVAQGKALITATVTVGNQTATAEAVVAVLDADAAFLTYNVTDGGWAAISRADATQVTNLTEGEEVGVQAIASNGTEVIAVDVENNLFSLNLETFERNHIAALDTDKLIGDYLRGFGYDEETIADALSYFAFEVRDMSYDAANDRYLVLGNVCDAEWGDELNGGNSIYALDVETGALEQLYNFSDLYYMMAMAVDAEGYVYTYTAFSDHYYKVDLEAGEYQQKSTLQTLSYYGDPEYDHAMYYDDLTGMIYHAFTSNGNFYRLFAINPGSGAITLESEFLGDVVMDEETWAYVADAYAGLTFADMPKAEYTAEWVSTSASLGGNIGLNFMAKLSADVVNDPETFVQFTYADKVLKVPMSQAVEADRNGETVYRFTCPLTAKNMADEVTAQVFSANGAVGNAATLSLAAYVEAVLDQHADNAKLVDLMKAMVNYGAAAQVHFGYNTENLANAILAEADQVLVDVDASAYAHSKTGAEEGIDITSAALLLDTNTIIRFYITLTGDKTIDEYTVTVNGKEVTPVASGNRYYVDVTDIGAHNLDQVQVLAIGDLSMSFSALSYVDLVLKKDASEDLVDLVKALYAYAMAAENYIK